MRKLSIRVWRAAQKGTIDSKQLRPSNSRASRAAPASRARFISGHEVRSSFFTGSLFGSCFLSPLRQDRLVVYAAPAMSAGAAHDGENEDLVHGHTISKGRPNLLDPSLGLSGQLALWWLCLMYRKYMLSDGAALVVSIYLSGKGRGIVPWSRDADSKLTDPAREHADSVWHKTRSKARCDPTRHSAVPEAPRAD